MDKIKRNFRMRIKIASAALCMLLFGCSSDSKDTQDLAESLSFSVQSPLPNSNAAGADSITVSGLVIDAQQSDAITQDDVTSVLINGTQANLDATSNRWSSKVSLSEGLNNIEVKVFSDEDLVGVQEIQVLNDTPVPRLESPVFGVLREENNSLLVVDSYQDALFSIDLTSSALVPLSTLSSDTASTSLSSAKAAALNSEAGLLYVAAENVVEIDLTTGERTVLLDSEPFRGGTPEGVLFDSTQNQLYVLFGDVLGLYKIDLSSGSLSTISTNIIYTNTENSDWDLTTSSLYSFYNLTKTLFSTDIQTGEEEELADLSNYTQLGFVSDITVSPDGSALYLTSVNINESNEEVYKVATLDLNTLTLSIDSSYGEFVSELTSLVISPSDKTQWIIDRESETIFQKVQNQK